MRVLKKIRIYLFVIHIIVFHGLVLGENQSNFVASPAETRVLPNVFSTYTIQLQRLPARMNQESMTGEGEVTNALESMRNHLQDISMKNNKILLENESSLKTDPSNKKLRMKIRKTELMLAHNFGRFAQGKNNQEVSWNWMDFGVLTGIHKMTETYQRQNKRNSFPGYTWYINLSKFT